MNALNLIQLEDSISEPIYVSSFSSILYWSNSDFDLK